MSIHSHAEVNIVMGYLRQSFNWDVLGQGPYNHAGTGVHGGFTVRTVARKFSIGGLCVFAGGLDTLKIDKILTDL